MNTGVDQHLLRSLVPQVLAIVTRRFGDFCAAEDALQEALLAAAQQWPLQGVPKHPRAWLVQVASRRLMDQLRSELARRQRETDSVAFADESLLSAPPPEYVDDSDGDDTLALLYLCCHPALSPASAVALTLRAVAGLSTAQIATAFLVPEVTLAQRISRAKRTIRDSGIAFETPTSAERERRLAPVLQVLYLVFNEGYVSSAGADLQQTDLAAEAIRLARLLHTGVRDHTESAGLLALMLLTHARRAARCSPAGELVPLAEQDRRRWDRSLITEGVALISRTLPQGRVGPYQLQAAIAAVHDEAESAEATDWPQILALYTVLQRLGDNPMVTLNLAVATAMVQGAAAGLARLQPLYGDARMTRHHRLAAVHAHLLELSGDKAGAAAQFRRAAALTPNLAERRYLGAKSAACVAESP